MTLSELLDFQSNRSRLEEIRRNRRNIVPLLELVFQKAADCTHGRNFFMR